MRQLSLARPKPQEAFHAGETPTPCNLMKTYNTLLHHLSKLPKPISKPDNDLGLYMALPESSGRSGFFRAC